MPYLGFFLKHRNLIFFLVLALGIAYSNSFFGPFIYDDLKSILDNPSIRSLLEAIQLTYFSGETVTGRPVLNFSLSVNYALGGFSVFGYHFFNFLIHLSATLTLFGILRRTFVLPVFSDSIRNESIALAGAVAGLWGIHPIQTGAVTYVVQRAESLMSLFYLLTLYCFLLSLSGRKSVFWLSASIVCCYLGMGTKEVMISAPFIVILYDWIFIESRFQRIWSQRRIYYYGLLSSWGLALYLNLCAKSRDGVYGYFGEISLAQHLQTQSWAIVHYLKLIFIPHPLVLDYGIVKVSDLKVVVPCTIFLIGIGIVIVWLLFKNRKWGFWGIWTFALLAPTSTIIPMQTEPIAEHRVYLGMLSVIILIVFVFYYGLGKKSYLIFFALGLVWGCLTYQRNNDFQSVESIWEKNVTYAPLNPRGHNNYAGALYERGKIEEAEFHLREAIRLEPRNLNAYLNYGELIKTKGDLHQAEIIFRESLMRNPHFSAAKISLSQLYIEQNKILEAEKLYYEVVEESPRYPLSYLNLGLIFESRKEWEKAETIYLKAIENGVDHPEIIKRLEKIQERLME